MTEQSYRSQANDCASELERKLESQSAVIGVVGLGYVGLPLAVEFARAGFQTIGIDLDHRKVRSVNAGESYIEDVDSTRLSEVVKNGVLQAVMEPLPHFAIDVYFICVPTPITQHKDPDITYIEAAGKLVADHIGPGTLVILKSTTYPGTTENVLLPLLENGNRSVGKSLFLAFSPERVDPGNRDYHTGNTPVVVGGVTKTCTRLAGLAMQQIIAEIHPVSSPKIAEMEKLLENTFRSVNIALVNELALLCDRMGDVNIWEVVEAAATKPFGFMPFFPGPGLGGHCIPIDPYYLSWIARRFDFETSFVSLSARINESMPYYVMNAVIRAVAEQDGTLENSRILILGIAFKKNVSDTRHSPAVRIMELLVQHGIRSLRYVDPFVPDFTLAGSTYVSEEFNEETIRAADVVLVLTDHDDFDYDLVASTSRAVIDTRNALSSWKGERSHIQVMGSGRF